MRAIRVLIVSGLLLALGGLAGASAQVFAAADPGTPDTLRVDSSVAYASGKGIVPVYLFNDEPLTSVEAVLRTAANQIKVDSFSFAGGRLNLPGADNRFQVTQGNTVLTVFSLPGSMTIPAGSGLVGNIYFSYPVEIPLGVYPIDTTSWSFGLVLHSTTLGVSEGTFIPKYKRGYLDIQESPSTLDSLWIDRVEATPGNPVALNIYAYNERALSEIAVALNYGSTRLAFDSMTFTGTRGAAATNKVVQEQATAHTLYTRLEFGDANPLEAGTGVLATMHFTIDALTPETLIVLDTVIVGLNSITQFTLTDIDGSVTFVPIYRTGWVDVKISTGVDDDDSPSELIPSDFELAQNYPNPFNPSTTIEFSLPTASQVRIEVFNVLGQSIRELVNGMMPAGVHHVVFDSKNDAGEPVATGVYFYRLETGDHTMTRKMLLLK